MENERREFLKALDFGSHTGEFHKTLVDAIDKISKPELINQVVISKPTLNGTTERINFHIIGIGAHMPSIFHRQFENRIWRDGMPDPLVVIVDDIDLDQIKKVLSEKDLFHEKLVASIGSSMEFHPEYLRGVPPVISLMDRVKNDLSDFDKIQVAKRIGEQKSFDAPQNYLFTEPPRQKKSRNFPDKITIARMNKRKKKR